MFMHTMSPSSMNGWILSTTCKHHIPKVMTLAVWRMLNIRDTLFSFFNQKFRWGECPVQTLVSLLILVKCLPNVVYRIPCKAGAKYTPNTVCKAKSTYESQDIFHKNREISILTIWITRCSTAQRLHIQLLSTWLSFKQDNEKKDPIPQPWKVVQGHPLSRWHWRLQDLPPSSHAPEPCQQPT
jgi:hypothetical protein